MRHRLQHKVFDGGENRSSSPQKSRTSSTFTIGKNPHLTKTNKLHSKSTYFYRWGSKLSSKLNYAVPSTCALALLIGGIIALSPILNDIEKVHAEEGIAATSDTPPTISIKLAAGDASASRRTPAKAGEITYRTDVFTIGGTGITHYAASLNTPTGKTGELVGKKNSYVTVGKVADNTASADFAENTWGYAITNDTTTADIEKTLHYNPVPSGMDSSNNSVEIVRRMGIDKATTVADSYKIAFAANLGKNLPADDYMADVYLSVVASPQATISNITTMQEMDSNVCTESLVGDTKQLEDTRDRKKYWIAKLVDKNCWMTQNLDYDIPTGSNIKLSSTDTDVTTDTTLNQTVIKIASDGNVASWSNNNTQVKYYDPGFMYKSNPTSTNGCGNSSVTSLTHDNCKQAGWTTTTQSSLDNNPAQAHYSVGNYYSWNAATAGSGSNTSNHGDIAANSICPKGWHLPTSGNGSYNTTGSFAYLLRQYNLATSDNGGNAGTPPNSVTDAPMYWLRAGGVDSSYLAAAGSLGYYWSSVANVTTNALNFYFDSNTRLYPSNGMARYYGYPVRCVAK